VDYISEAKLLHVTGITQGISTSACNTVFAAIAVAKETGVLVSYDPNLRLKLWSLERAKAIIHEIITLVDLIFPSYEDASTLTRMTGPEEIIQFYLNLGPKVVVLKTGPEGAFLETKERIERFIPYHVNTVDMSGAGDTFDGAFVVGYLSNWPLEKCVRFANAAAALTTTGLGCVAPIPRRKNVESLMAQQESRCWPPT
jgi:2-dehydro-3-deoxygluconokinase